jgi:methylmalonyl-CoA mutase
MLDNNDKLFSEFQATTKKQWLARIEKDLKGRPISELYWQLTNPLQGAEHLIVDPFAHATDFKGQMPEPIVVENTPNIWAISEHIEVKNDVKTANKQALKALMGGVNAPHFVFDIFPTAPQLELLLKDIELDYISIYFSMQHSKHKYPLILLKTFAELATEKKVNLHLLRGGISFDPFSSGRHDMGTLKDILLWTKEHLPLFKVITIDAGYFFKGSENVVAELAQTLKAGENYLKRSTNAGIEIGLIANAMQFNFHIDTFYFIEIAKIRAFKILWANVLAAYETPSVATPSLAKTVTEIHAIIAPDTQGEDTHTNKIRATTQAMSAVLAGVSSLTIAPSDVNRGENDDFNRRIARNIQHLLQMESYFDRVADPAAGSYYIEQLTTQIAEAAWVYFQEIVDVNN